MWRLFKFINLFYILVSSYAWFGSIFPVNLLNVSILGLIGCMAFGSFGIKITSRVYVIIGVVFLFYIYTILNSDFSDASYLCLPFIPGILIFVLDKPHSVDLLRFVSKWLSIMLGVSLGWYILSMVVPLPHTTFVQPNNDFYQAFENYFFFIKSTQYASEAANTTRFGAFFLEPGHLSMVCTLILFANRYQIKKYPYLLMPLLCIIFSYSLVGYILILVSVALLAIKNVIYMIITVSILSGGLIFVTDVWNAGNNPVNILIIQRMELDKDKGIKGNNRTGDITDYFYRQSVKDGTIWRGVQNNEKAKQKIIGAGYKVYFLRFGIISAIFVTALYLLFIKPKANKRYAYSFFTIIVLLFMQRAYPGWYAWLFSYITGIGAMVGEKFFASSTPQKKKKLRQTMILPALSSDREEEMNKNDISPINIDKD